MCAVYTDVPTYVRGSPSVHSCVREIMHVCACKYVYAMVCLYADQNWPITVYGLIAANALLVYCFSLCFSVYIVCVCIIAFDMVVLCEAMLICLLFLLVYRVYIIAVAR